MGRLLVENGKAGGALAAFAPVMAAGRDSPDDDLALAAACLSDGDREQAKDALRRAVKNGAPIRVVRVLAEKIDHRFAQELEKPER